MAGKSSVVRVAIVADNSSLTRGLKESQSRLASFGKTVAKLGVAAGAAAGIGLAAFGKAAVDAASDAQQSLGATETVFGKFSKSIIDNSNKAAEAVGLSSNEYRENANVLGSLLANQGVAAGQLAGKTSDLIKVGADLAATFGGSTKDAVDALASAFKGEFDPLERYGISLKQATINTEAWKVAGVSSNKAFTALSDAQQKHAKQVASTNLLMGQAAKIQGSFARETDTLAHKQQVLAAEFANAKAKIGNALLPVITDLTQYLSDHAIPKLEEFGQWLGDHQADIAEWGAKAASAAQDIGRLGTSVGQTLLPPLQTATGLVIDAVEAFNELPGPVKKLGVEVAVAAAAFYKFGPALTGAVGSLSTGTAKLKQFHAEMTYAETRGTALKGALGKIAPAAKAAAGAGGLALLADSASQSNQKLKLLEGTAGGAATGFAVAGPWGAAIGGAAGLLLNLKGAFEDTEQAARDAARVTGTKDAFAAAKAGADELTDALNGTVKAYNDVTAAAVQKGFRDADGQILPWVQHLMDAGVSMDTLTRAMLGQADAAKVVSKGQQTVNNNLAARKNSMDAAVAAQKAYNDEVARDVAQSGRAGPTREQVAQMRANEQAVKDTTNDYKDYKAQVDQGANATGKMTAAVTGHKAELQSLARQLGITVKQYASWPKAVRTKFEADGLPQTMTQVKDLAKQYKLTPKQITSIFKATGIKVSRADAKQLGIDYSKLPKEVKTKAKFDKGTAVSDSHKYGQDAGSSWGSGYAAGVSSWVSEVARRAEQVAAAAHAAAMREQRSQSPSKKAHQVGQYWTQGYARGIESETPRAAAAAKKTTKAAETETEKAAKGAKKAGKKWAKQYAQGIKDGFASISSAITSGVASLFNIETSPTAQLKSDITAQVSAAQHTLVTQARKTLSGRAERRAVRRINREFRAAQQQVNSYTASLSALYDKQQALQSGNYLGYLSKSSKLYHDMTKLGVHNLDEATAKLDELTQASAAYVDGIKGVFTSFADITQLGRDEDNTVSFQAMLNQLQTRVVQAQRFQDLISHFASMGLSQSVIDQLVQAGPEAALATAEAIQSGIATQGQSAITQLNQMTGQIAAAGSTLANQLNTRFYSTGIQMAQGIVSGLQSQQAQLNAAATSMANALVAAVQSALHIHSPSKVFEDIGQQVAAGLAVGTDSPTVAAAGQSMASTLVSAFGTPGLTATAVNGTTKAMSVEVRLSAQQISQLERGRSIQVDLDAYRSAGGRGATR